MRIARLFWDLRMPGRRITNIEVKNYFMVTTIYTNFYSSMSFSVYRKRTAALLIKSITLARDSDESDVRTAPFYVLPCTHFFFFLFFFQVEKKPTQGTRAVHA